MIRVSSAGVPSSSTRTSVSCHNPCVIRRRAQDATAWWPLQSIFLPDLDMEPWVQHVPMAVPKIISKWSKKSTFLKVNWKEG